MYFAMPKSMNAQTPQTQDPEHKIALSEALARTVNLGRTDLTCDTSAVHYPFKRIPMTIYPRLVENLNKDRIVTELLKTGDVVVQIKGSAAYQYIQCIASRDRDLLPGGDVDIAVYINPHVDRRKFDSISSAVHIIIMQTLSQYKRCLDHMFCIDQQQPNQIRDIFLDDAQVADFKMELARHLPEDFRSPFEDIETRNKVSKQSFIIVDSSERKNDVMHIDIPHFEMCEKIPLRRSPFVCSHNRTISFDRCDDLVFGTLAPENGCGSFDLFRMKLNFLMNKKEIQGGRDYETVGAEFIDISVPRQCDAELHGFFDGTYDGTDVHWDGDIRCEMRVPTLDSAIEDLFRMLYVYVCPESKREKRRARYEKLLAIREQRRLVG
jgi:hypothetical protein